jgi:DNA topoisomerase-1
MANAVYDSVAVEVESAGHGFRANSSSLKFSGYTAVYEEGRDEEKEEKESPLPALQEGEVVTLKDFSKDQHFTQPPAHYTDATLIRAMEEQGIGRPSTYAPTVSTILDREYVMKEGKYLHITNLGRTVTELMKERFTDIADLKFTANMELKLDSVEEGTVAWKDVLRDFYGDFDASLKDAEKALEGTRIKVPDEVSEELCPECGKNLVVKTGRFGRFLACPGYPDCTFTMPLVVQMPGRCPACGGRLFKRTGTSKKTGKQFTYYACEKCKDCPWRVEGLEGKEIVGFMTWDVPVKDDCPVCGHTMFKKAGKGFKRPYCINPACSNFLPEEKRGYTKKAAAAEKKEEAAAEKETGKKAPAKKTADKKPAAKKTTTKKTTTKKTTTKKAAAKKEA